MNGLESLLRAQMRSIYLTDQVSIEHRTGETWGAPVTALAHVQHRREQISSDDPHDARPNERYATVVYLDTDTVVDVGDRVTHQGTRYHVATATPHRTIEPYRRIEIEHEQIGVISEAVTFTRRVDTSVSANGWQVLGTFLVHRTIDQRVPLDSGRASVFEASTASAARVTGSMISTDPAFAIVQAGDWFTIGEMPGRVLVVDRSNDQRIEIEYQLETRGV